VGGISAESAFGFGARSGLDHIISSDNPGTRNGIFAEFHGSRKTLGYCGVNSRFGIAKGGAAFVIIRAKPTCR
jgi:hypothetical protein